MMPRGRRRFARLALASIGLASSAPDVMAQPTAARAAPRTEREMSSMQIRIPESMRLEHEGIHSELERITRMPGRIGIAARELAAVLHPHFVREEQIALPPLGLLEPLARGEFSSGMRAVLAMTDSLRTELPRMLEEHKAIRAATLRLRDVAQAERNVEVEQFAATLALHARSEEELFYPAAVLVGEVVRARARP
jgi:hypothetical protein